MWVSLKTACWPRTLERPATPPVPRTEPTDGAAAVGEEGDGLLDLAVVGVAAEGAVAMAEGAVDAEVELVLVVGVVGGAGVVVGGGGEVGGCGEAGEQGFGGGIEAGGVDGVVGELVCGRDSAVLTVVVVLGRRCGMTPVKMPCALGERWGWWR